MNEDSSGAKQKRFNGSFLMLLLLLGGTLAVLCRQGFRPYEVFWANDLPLGALVESSAKLPGSFFGYWSDFYWLGGANVAFPPNLSNILMAILTPQIHLKVYPPLSMCFLGFGAWFFFRQLRFSPMARLLGLGHLERLLRDDLRRAWRFGQPEYRAALDQSRAGRPFHRHGGHGGI